MIAQGVLFFRSVEYFFFFAFVERMCRHKKSRPFEADGLRSELSGINLRSIQRRS